jgi:hypothetical protein
LNCPTQNSTQISQPHIIIITIIITININIIIIIKIITTINIITTIITVNIIIANNITAIITAVAVNYIDTIRVSSTGLFYLGWLLGFLARLPSLGHHS